MNIRKRKRNYSANLQIYTYTQIHTHIYRTLKNIYIIYKSKSLKVLTHRYKIFM